MKNLALLLVWMLLATCSATAQEMVALFNRSSYEGWTFVNNAGIELTSQNISRGRVALLTTVQGTVQELISPTLDCTGIDSLKVQIIYQIQATNYAKTNLMLTLKDATEQAVNSTTVNVAKNEPYQELETVLAINDTGSYRLHFTAPNADVDNSGSGMQAKILAYRSATHGDVDGDSKVDVSDVNAVINIILKTKLATDYPGNADIDNDGKVDVSDVNAIINLILKLE